MKNKFNLKIVNKVAKGNRVEKLAKEYLMTKHKFILERKPRVRFQSPDFYGLFDLLGFNNTHWCLVQVKSNSSDFYKARKDIKKWVELNQLPENTAIIIMLYLGNNKWRIEQLINLEWI